MADKVQRGGLKGRRVPLPQSQRYHAMSRMYERFGICLLVHEYDALCRIAGDRGLRRVLHRQPDQREVQAILVRDWWIICVYDPRTRMILTFLPSRAIDEFGFHPPQAA